jgi:hypothetical protein
MPSANRVALLALTPLTSHGPLRGRRPHFTAAVVPLALALRKDQTNVDEAVPEACLLDERDFVVY